MKITMCVVVIICSLLACTVHSKAVLASPTVEPQSNEKTGAQPNGKAVATDKDKIVKIVAFKKDFTANITALQRAENALYNATAPAIQKTANGPWVCSGHYVAFGEDASGKPICKAGKITPVEHKLITSHLELLLATETKLQAGINANNMKQVVAGLDTSDAEMQALLDMLSTIGDADSRASLQSLALPAKSTLVTAKAMVQPL